MTVTATDIPLMQRLDESAGFIRQRFELPVKVGMILGSGLGAFAEGLPGAVNIPYHEIPHFPKSHGQVQGHAGRLVLSSFLPNCAVACMQGRFHYYEGHGLSEVTYPVRVMKQLGAEVLIVTNAAGGLNPAFRPGSLMLIKDHLNLMGINPLRGQNCDDLGPRFPDMSEAYSRELRELAESCAETLSIQLEFGDYAAVSGPSYETPAEVQMIRTLGADAVGMSTVPEVIVANHMGMKVLGISCITNMAAGMSKQKLSHAEVMETGEAVKGDFIRLLSAVLEALAQS